MPILCYNRAIMGGIVLGITYLCLFISLYFEVFMTVTFLQLKFARAKTPTPPIDRTNLPTVAIIVPCFNEEKSLANTMHSLLALDYPHSKIEIIVVDDGSKDGTLAIANLFKHDPRVRVFHKENGGKHSAMNFALAHTEATLIGCLDADSTVASEALLKITPVFQNERVAAVTPGILIKKPETLLQHMQNAEYRLSVFNRFTLAALGSAFITPGPFSIFRSAVVREAGGWKHGHSTEDLEMALRIQNAGYLIANAPKAVVYTGTPRTIPALFRQRVRWTYGFLRNAIDYKHMFGSRKYGNLGIIILPTALLSIAIAIYFFIRTAFFFLVSIVREITRIEIMGFSFKAPTFSLYYVNTSAIWFLIFTSIMLVLVLISIGSMIGTGKRHPPKGTPLFVVFYSFLVPLWLGTAVIRAIFKTGVRWR